MREHFQLHLSAVVRKDKKPRQRSENTCTTLKVHSGVWQAALQLAEGNIRRLEVISAEVVRVHNRPYR